MRDFSVHAKPTSRKGKVLFLSLFSVAAMLFVTYGTFVRYRGIVGLIALVFLTFAIFVLTKYVLSEYYYDICMTDTPDPLFVVRQKVGKRSVTLCRISIKNIVKVQELTHKEYKANEREAGYVKYVYSPTILPEKLIYIKVSSRHEHAEIYIEGTGELAKMLSDYAKELRATQADEDE